jgi:hypothetical protein
LNSNKEIETNIPLAYMSTYFIYTIIDENNKAYPVAFTSYDDALNKIKKVQDNLRDTKGYEDWRDNDLNEIDVKEGNKINKDNKNPNETELYIEKGMYISIYKLELKPKLIRRHSI